MIVNESSDNTQHYKKTSVPWWEAEVYTNSLYICKLYL